MIRTHAARALRLVLLLAFALLGSLAEAANDKPQDEAKRLEALRAVVARIDKEQETQLGSFAGLLTLRGEIEPVREELAAIVAAHQQRFDAAKARAAEFGPAPAAGAAEPKTVADERRQAQKAMEDAEGRLKDARAVQVRADQLWDELTDQRRDLFSSRILDHRGSFLEPALWRDLVTTGVPALTKRATTKWAETRTAVADRLGRIAFTGQTAALAALLLWLVVLRFLVPGYLRRTMAGDGDTVDEVEAMRRAVLVVGRDLLPWAAAMLAIWIGVVWFDLVPKDLRDFLLGLGRTGLAYGLGVGVTRAAFAPEAPAHRLVRCDDRTARRMVRVMRAMLAIHVVGLVLLGAVALLSAPVSATVVITGLASAFAVAVGALLLFGEPAAVDQGAEARGSVRLPVHLLRPIFWIFAVVVVAALAFGFVAFAGFIVGRALASLVIICLMVVAQTAIDELVHRALSPGRRPNALLARSLGLKPTIVDLFGTMVAGLLRVFVVGLTILVLTSPWGIEFGNLNPFEDVFFGVRFGELRGWIGTAGIAAVLFVLGLVATRVFVGWLDGQLLPRTTLSAGSANSISTVAGYVGFFAALALALTQAGVQLQNVALVASALSVGIGFGLQQIVSNFVAGLIVLAERPIRVGDVIVVKGEEGRVRKINVRATELQLAENSIVVVPNSDIISSTVKNRSLSDLSHRASVKFLLMHDADLDRAVALLEEIAAARPSLVNGVPPTVLVTAVTELAVEVELHVMVDSVARVGRTKSDIYRTALKRLREAGVPLARSNSILEAPPAPPAPPEAETSAS